MAYTILAYLLEAAKLQLLVFGILKCPKKKEKYSL